MARDFNQLKKDVQAMAGRTDPETIKAIPGFIEAAQTRLDSILRIGSMVSLYTTEEAALSVEMPFMEIDNVIIGGYEAVMFPLADVLAKRAITNNQAFYLYYAVNGNNIELTSPQNLSVTGYERPPRLSTQTPTNAYTDGAYNALMWAALSFLGVFVRDSEMAQSWGALSDQEVENLNEAYGRYKSAGGLASQAPQQTDDWPRSM